MTDNLVKRLRGMCGDDGILAIRDIYDHDVAEAADRIEKLEAALREIITHCEVPERPNARALRLIARTALEGEDD